ncbi:MAG: hypothetical protein E6Z25_03995 [Negativicoccus succinicivorans]|uniref:hypothetical protein n=1 Tax=Negativicoccus succinicivorans TaxID=620903 RepID=UPI002913F2A5|nr:hypothetical protein [Negativicoccus succinicivorans]MDU5915218.1 hypothetical protein [Negativicoccus succinicivorans]
MSKDKRKIKNPEHEDIRPTAEAQEDVEKLGAHVPAPQVETKPAAQETPVVHDERDLEAENLIRWGAARAGVISMTPFLGGIALMANEVYMISRLAKVYDVKLSDRTIMSFLGAFGARVVGSVAAMMIPIPGVGLPVAVSVTYGVGRVAQSWIKDGLPLDIKPYVEKFEDLKQEGREKVEEIANDVKKDEPLGDETQDFMEDYAGQAKVHKFLGTADKALTELLLTFGVSQAQIDDKKALAKGIFEVTKDTAGELALELKERVNEASADAKLRADLLKDQAQQKADEVKEKSVDWQAKAEGKVAELKDRVQEKAAEAKEKAAEAKEKATDKAAELKERVQEKAAEAKEEAADKAAELKDKVEARAEEIKEEQKH